MFGAREGAMRVRLERALVKKLSSNEIEWLRHLANNCQQQGLGS